MAATLITFLINKLEKFLIPKITMFVLISIICLREKAYNVEKLTYRKWSIKCPGRLFKNSKFLRGCLFERGI